MAKIQVRARSNKWLGWKPDTPDYRDHVYRAPSGPIPPAHMLPANLIPHILDQGQQGSCTGHAAAGVAAYLHHWSGQKTSDRLSPRFAYWNARAYESSTAEDSGAEIRDVVKGIVNLGVCVSSLCKYDPAVWNRKPTAAAFKGALKETITEYQRINNGDVTAVKAALAQDIPVIFGFACYANIDDPAVASTGMLTMPSGPNEGGHAVWKVGYDDNLRIGNEVGAFCCMNSWGTDWGCQPEHYPSRGFFWMPYKYSGNPNLADDFWACMKIT